MADFADLVVKLELQQAQFQKGMDQAARSLARVQQNAKGAQSAMGGLERGLSGVAQAAAAAATAFGTFKGVEAIVKAADAVRNLQGSFTALLGDGQRAGDMMLRVFQIVERTGAPLEAVGASTQRLIIAMGQLGASNNQIATVAETFIKLGKVGGSSAAETAAALQQLGQALASGKLGGDELRSIRENAPLVAQAIAESIGVTSGQLKQLGEDGKLTSDVVANALIAAADKAAAKFAELPQGFEQATNKMAAQATALAAEFDKVGGTTTILVTTINFVADAFKRWADELKGVNDQASTTKILVESVNDLMRLASVVFVAVTFALEAIIKRTAFWAEQLKALVDLDWTAMKESSKRFADEMDRAADAASRTIDLLLNPPKAPFGKVEGDQETGGFPLVAGRRLKPPGGGGGGGGKGKSDAEREAEQLKKRGEALAANVDQLNAYNQKMIEYRELLEKGAISENIFAKAVAKAKDELAGINENLRAGLDPLAAYGKEMERLEELFRQGAIDLERFQIATGEAAKKMDEALKGKKGKDGEKTFDEQLRELEEDMAKATGTAIGEFFGDLVRGSMSAQDAFKKMTDAILQNLAKLLAEFAAAQITKAILSFLPGATGSGTQFAAPGALMLASRPTTWNARASLAGPFAAAPRLGAAPGETTAGAASSSPWSVVINNNAPGVDVTAAPSAGGALEVTVERVRSVLAQDVARGGNHFSRSLESAYGLGRGRGGGR